MFILSRWERAVWSAIKIASSVDLLWRNADILTNECVYLQYVLHVLNLMVSLFLVKLA